MTLDIQGMNVRIGEQRFSVAVREIDTGVRGDKLPVGIDGDAILAP